MGKPKSKTPRNRGGSARNIRKRDAIKGCPLSHAERLINEITPPKIINDSSSEEVIVLKGGQKNKGWSKELNKPLKPNTKYEVDGYLYETDDLGRIKSVSGELQMLKRGRNEHQQRKSKKIKDGIEGDHGGHLIGDRFFGPGEQLNYVPMMKDLNSKAWKQMEDLWAKARAEKPPKVVRVDISNIYLDSNKRPIGLEVIFEICEQREKSGKVEVRIFENYI